MPYPTSDFHKPVCFEMRTLKSNHQHVNNLSLLAPPLTHPLSMAAIQVAQQQQVYSFKYQQQQQQQQQPPTSASASIPPTAAIIEKGTSSTTDVPTSSSSMIRSQVKKSASGDTALRNLCGTSPMDDNYDVQEVLGSRVSLNEIPVPKHRKTRFQQSASSAVPTVAATKPRARFENPSKQSQESLGESKKRRSSFMPAKSLASATKLINQHLFGIQNIGTKAKLESKHSSSIDSIDVSPNLEHHRRSKSILKNKSDAAKIFADPESERLLSDNMSGSGISDNGTVMGESGSDYSPNKLPHTVLAKSISPPPIRHRTLIQQRSGPATLQSKPTKFQTPRYPEQEQQHLGRTSASCSINNQQQGKVHPLSRTTANTHIEHLSGGGRFDSVNSSLDSETTFTSNLRDRDDGSSEENRSLLHRGSSNEKSESGGPS